MALTAKSIFLYGYTVTTMNQSLDFQAVLAETARTATLRLGYYSLDGLLREIVRAMEAVDTTRTYAASAARTLSGGLANRVTISTTDGTYLNLLFASGPNAATNCAALIGFAVVDQTGALTYTGSLTTGTYLQPNGSGYDWQAGIFGYNFNSPETQPRVMGSLNVATSGLKEEVIFNVQNFWDAEFKYITADEVAPWMLLVNWMILARPIEFTPEISDPTIYYEGTIETTSTDNKAMGFLMKEMLPQFPNFYQTGPMKFRQRLSS